jgi:hypothetical protein
MTRSPRGNNLHVVMNPRRATPCRAIPTVATDNDRAEVKLLGRRPQSPSLTATCTQDRDLRDLGDTDEER